MLKHAFAAGFVGLTLAPALAQTRPPVVPVVVVAPARPAFCPEGRLPNGACQNPRIAALARINSCLTTQGAISFSAGPPCTTVIQDHDYRYPNAVYNDTKRQLDIAFNRGSGSFQGYGQATGSALVGVSPPFTVVTFPTYGPPRTGPGSPNPPRYPLY